MSNVGISYAEKRYLRHLRMGGQPDDDVGKELVWQFCTKVWSEPAVAPALRAHGVTIQELAWMYAEVIRSLMPRPWMNVGGPLLVPTQWFMEPHRIENLLVEVSRDTSGQSREVWLRVLLDKASVLARLTREVHDEKFGPPSVETIDAGGVQSARGCAGMLFLALGVLVAAGACWSR